MSDLNAVEGNVRRQWVLEGLDCANCAMKIENKVKKIEGVSSCSVNFTMKMMTLETAAAYADTVSEEAKRTVTTLEPHVKLKEVQTAGGRQGRATDIVTLMAVMKPKIMIMHMMKLMATPIAMSMGKGIRAKSCCGWAPAEF